jgi:peptidoglycan/xylan/chitin deacetylase (PgdA/CDA1 family)
MNTVIAFHVVTDAKWFEDMICRLKSAYRLVPIEALVDVYAGHTTSGNLCHLTVDDGDRSFFNVMFPVLKKHKVHASLFVSPRVCAENANFWFQEIDGYCPNELKRLAALTLKVPLASVNQYCVASIFKSMTIRQIEQVIRGYQRSTNTARKKGRNMSVSELMEVDRSGVVSIGAHTIRHPILKNETDDICRWEIDSSVTELSELLGRQVRYFAYPNGMPAQDFTKREEAILKNRGIQLAFTTESRHLSASDIPMRIPRIQITNQEKAFTVRLKCLLGSGWHSLRKVKITGEHAERKRFSGRVLRFAEESQIAESSLVQAEDPARERSGIR